MKLTRKEIRKNHYERERYEIIRKSKEYYQKNKHDVKFREKAARRKAKWEVINKEKRAIIRKGYNDRKAEMLKQAEGRVKKPKKIIKADKDGWRAYPPSE